MDDGGRRMSAAVGHPAVFIASAQSLTVPERSALASRYEYVLVANADHYSPLVDAGTQPILVSRGFSETDTRARYRLKLGALIVPWRWRRVLLNENIDRLTVQWGAGAVSVIGGALLAGARWRIVRM